MRVRIALGALGAGLGTYAIAFQSWKPGAITLPIAVQVAVGWSFVAAGLVSAARLPDSRGRTDRGIATALYVTPKTVEAPRPRHLPQARPAVGIDREPPRLCRAHVPASPGAAGGAR
jgi:hypothetical protein